MTESTPGERLRHARRAAGISAAELGRRAAQSLGRDRPISESAVRNQENGTNGIPLDTVTAYAAILNTTPEYILWGSDSEGENATAPQQAEGVYDLSADEILDTIAVPVLGIISGLWSPAMVNPNVTSDRQWIYIHIPGFHAERDRLRAYEVIDASLEPDIRKGSYIVVADFEDMYGVDGSYVIAGRWRGGEILYAVRQLRTATDGVDLATVGRMPEETLPLVRAGESSDDVFPEWLLIAVMWQPAPLGMPLFIPPAPHMSADASGVDVESPEGRRATRELLKEAYGGDDQAAFFEGVRIEQIRRIGDKGDR